MKFQEQLLRQMLAQQNPTGPPQAAASPSVPHQNPPQNYSNQPAAIRSSFAVGVR